MNRQPSQDVIQDPPLNLLQTWEWFSDLAGLSGALWYGEAPIVLLRRTARASYIRYVVSDQLSEVTLVEDNWKSSFVQCLRVRDATVYIAAVKSPPVRRFLSCTTKAILIVIPSEQLLVHSDQATRQNLSPDAKRRGQLATRSVGSCLRSKAEYA